MKLYSKNGSEPEVVHMLVFSDGSTRTGDDYTEEEYERAGYTGPYIRPECDEYFQKLSWNSQSLEYIVSDYSDEEYMAKIREYRNYLLRESDLFMIEDFAIDTSAKNNWKKYRSWLRNIPQNIESGEISLPKNRKDYDDIFATNNPTVN